MLSIKTFCTFARRPAAWQPPLFVCIDVNHYRVSGPDWKTHLLPSSVVPNPLVWMAVSSASGMVTMIVVDLVGKST